MAEKSVMARGDAGERPGSLLKQVYRSFISMKTGIALLLLVMAASFLGTFIPPGKEHAVLGDVYHTWWFKAVLGLLCLNIFTCSTRRLPSLLKESRQPTAGHELKLETLPNYRRLMVKSSTEGTAVTAAVVLARHGFRVKTSVYNGLPAISADRGRLAPWGTMAVHLSVLVIIVGALYGNIAGSSHDISLPVGGSVEVTNSDYPGIGKPFSLKLNNFSTEYYKDGTVSDWISDITIEQNGQGISNQIVKVNQPLDYNGVRVYQFSYGTTLHTQIVDSQGNIVKEGGVAEREMLESNGLVVRPVRFVPDFNPNQPMVSASGELNNPHVLYIIYNNGREVDWGAAKLGETIQLGKNLGSVRFTAAQPFSGLQVKYDPGIPVVWLGFVMMAVGFFISLYTRRLRMWLTFVPSEGSIRLEAGGHGCSRLFEQTIDNLNKHFAQSEAGRRTN